MWYVGKKWYAIEICAVTHRHKRNFIITTVTWQDFNRMDRFANAWRGRHYLSRGRNPHFRYWFGNQEDHQHKVDFGYWDQNIPLIQCSVSEFFQHIGYDFKTAKFI